MGGKVDITRDFMEKHLIENMGLVKEGVPKETIMRLSPKGRAEGAEHRAVEKALRELGHRAQWHQAGRESANWKGPCTTQCEGRLE